MYMHTNRCKARGHLSPSVWLRLAMNWFWRVQSHAAQLCLASCTALYPPFFGKPMSICGPASMCFLKHRLWWPYGTSFDPSPKDHGFTTLSKAYVFKGHAVPGRISQVIVFTSFLRQMPDRAAERVMGWPHIRVAMKTCNFPKQVHECFLLGEPCLM